MAANRIFIDSNVLVYANNTLSSFCSIAQNRLDEIDLQYESLWLSRQVLREFVVIITREMLVNAGKVDYKLLESTVIRFEKDFEIAEENQAITLELLRLIKDTNTSGKQIHDANIVATMLVNDVGNILTNNVADFKRFAHLINILPLL